MVQKTIEEFYTAYGFSFLLVAIFAVAPAKGNVGFGYLQNPCIGDGPSADGYIGPGIPLHFPVNRKPVWHKPPTVF